MSLSNLNLQEASAALETEYNDSNDTSDDDLIGQELLGQAIGDPQVDNARP